MPTIKNKFHVDIKNMLTSFLMDQNLIKIDQVTPYGYRIDFVLHFDANHRPVPVPKHDGFFENITKWVFLDLFNLNLILFCLHRVAILLLKIDSFCQNNRSHLRGQEILRQRHLEILGYRVVQISYNEWNSMYMNLPGAKLNYLKKLLLTPTIWGNRNTVLLSYILVV